MASQHARHAALLARMSFAIAMALMTAAGLHPLREIAIAQSDAPDFEAAAIKRSDGAQSAAIQRAGNRLTIINFSLAMLITWAFDLEDDRLLGTPSAADSVRFDLIAKAPEDRPAPGRMQAMTRRLLEDRFHLRVHRESRELIAYVMRLDGEPKLRLSPQISVPGSSPFSMTRPGELAGKQVTPAMLATVLSSQLGRPVKDQTGLVGVFDFTLQWRPDRADASLDADRPSLFTALREQLGLKLEAQRAPTEVLVVDHLDLQPTEH
jgi:uncharacterized protein (TIGR03435 family)